MSLWVCFQEHWSAQPPLFHVALLPLGDWTTYLLLLEFLTILLSMDTIPCFPEICLIPVREQKETVCKEQAYRIPSVGGEGEELWTVLSRCCREGPRPAEWLDLTWAPSKS